MGSPWNRGGHIDSRGFTPRREGQSWPQARVARVGEYQGLAPLAINSHPFGVPAGSSVTVLSPKGAVVNSQGCLPLVFVGADASARHQHTLHEKPRRQILTSLRQSRREGWSNSGRNETPARTSLRIDPLSLVQEDVLGDD